MKKVLFGIFAHPDDEGFGPSATLMKEVDAGTEVHLIALTCGDAGTNPDNVPDLGAVREQEWRKAGELIGATGMYHLGYSDSHLCNGELVEISEKVEALVREHAADADEVEFMTFELGGISGHIDHIVAARATCQVFYRLKAESKVPVTRIRMFCVPETTLPAPNTDWIFMDRGVSTDQIDETIDVSAYLDRHIEVIRAHHSQRGDGAMHLSRLEENGRTKYDHFIIRT